MDGQDLSPYQDHARGHKRDHAERFIEHLIENKRSPNTQNKYLNIMGLVFRVLSDKAGITVNPWDSMTRKKLKTAGRRELTVEELRAVCAAAEGELKTLLALGLYTGLRLGDCCRLRWSDVDLVRGVLRVETSKRGKQVWVAIYPGLLPILNEAKAGNKSTFVVPGLAADYDRHISYVTDRVQTHFTKCGIETAGTKAGRSRAAVAVGFHSLRHSFVTLSQQAGTPLAVVQALVGHGSPQVTKLYTHIGTQAIGQAIAALPDVLSPEDAKRIPATPSRMERDAEIRRIVVGLTAENLDAGRDALLALIGDAQVAGVQS